MLKSVSLLKNSSFNEISEVINSALKLGCSRDFGYDYKVDFEEVSTQGSQSCLYWLAHC